MTIEELNKHYVKTTFLNEAIKMAKKQKNLTRQMLRKYFTLNDKYTEWLYEMVEQELKDVNLMDFLSSESND